MAENRKKKSEEKVRCPPNLMAELRQIQGAAQLRGEKPPSAGDLLWAAWKIARGKGDVEVARERPEAHQRALDDLDAIFASGDENLIGLVVTPLEFARRQLRRRAGESRKGE